MYVGVFVHTYILLKAKTFVSGLIFAAFLTEVRGFVFVTMSAYLKQTFKQAVLTFG